jgi:CBS domain-containing protein
MKVRDAMTRTVRSCGPDDRLDTVGETMIEVDCGVLPVVSLGKVVGVITDRDVCLALTRSDRRPSEVAVADVMSVDVAGCHPDDDVRAALVTMRRRGVRRLPVLGDASELLGLLSLDDVAVRASRQPSRELPGPSYAEIGETLETINRTPRGTGRPPRVRAPAVKRKP